MKRQPATVHPRGRGEQVAGVQPRLVSTGSSPRARGTGPPTTAQTDRSAVHPRGRGEQGCGDECQSLACGSSPRARGTAFLNEVEKMKGRFIPAGAGNSQTAMRRAPRTPVHPRGRGEQDVYGNASYGINGSSPRARGTEKNLVAGWSRKRFIPAGAGNSRSLGMASATMAVHPRGRGEQLAVGRPLRGSLGSSPRARGTGHQFG